MWILEATLADSGYKLLVDKRNGILIYRWLKLYDLLNRWHVVQGAKTIEELIDVYTNYKFKLVEASYYL